MMMICWGQISKENLDCSSFVMCPLLALPLSRAFYRLPLTVLTRQTRHAVNAINQSVFLRCLWPGVQYLMGESLKVAWAKFSTLSWAVLVRTAWHVNVNHMVCTRDENSAQALSFQLKGSFTRQISEADFTLP
jgi:hypothetical protein